MEDPPSIYDFPIKPPFVRIFQLRSLKKIPEDRHHTHVNERIVLATPIVNPQGRLSMVINYWHHACGDLYVKIYIYICLYVYYIQFINCNDMKYMALGPQTYSYHLQEQHADM